MELRFFAGKQLTAAEIKQKRLENDSKRAQKTNELSDLEGRLTELQAELRTVSAEIVLEESPDANRRKKALVEQIAETQRRIATIKEDLGAMADLNSELESREERAQRQEIFAKYDREGKELLSKCPEIQELYTHLGVLLRETKANAEKMNQIAWVPTGGASRCLSDWTDGMGAVAALFLDGVLPGFPRRIDFLGETLAEAEDLREFLKKRIETQRKKLSDSLNN